MTTTFHEKVEVRRAQSLISGITRAKFSVIQIQIVSFLRDDFPNRLGNQARIWKTKVLVQLRTRNKFACLHGLGMHFGIVVNPNPKPFLTILIILLNSSAEPCQGKPQKLECICLLALGSVFTRYFFKSFCMSSFCNIVGLPAGTNYFNGELSKSNRIMREFPLHRKTQFPLPYISKILYGRGLDTADWSSQKVQN